MPLTACSSSCMSIRHASQSELPPLSALSLQHHSAGDSTATEAASAVGWAAPQHRWPRRSRRSAFAEARSCRTGMNLLSYSCESGRLRPGSSTTRAPQRQRRIKGSFVLYPFLRPTHGHTSARAPTSNYLVPRLGFAVFPNFLSLDPSLGAPVSINASTCRPHRRASPLDLPRCSCFHLFETGPPSCPAPGLSLVLIPDRVLSPPTSCAVIASL